MTSPARSAYLAGVETPKYQPLRRPDPVADPAAEELPDRDLELLADDVPHRHLDRGQTALGDVAADPERIAGQVTDTCPKVHRVAADERPPEVLDVSDDGQLAPFEGRFADAHQTRVRDDLDEHPVPPHRKAGVDPGCR